MDKTEFIRTALVRYGFLVDFDGEPPKRLRQEKGTSETFKAWCNGVLGMDVANVVVFQPTRPAPNTRVSTLKANGQHEALAHFAAASPRNRRKLEAMALGADAQLQRLTSQRRKLKQQNQELEADLQSRQVELDARQSELASTRVGVVNNSKEFALQVRETLESLSEDSAMDELVANAVKNLLNGCDEPGAFSKELERFVKFASTWRKEKARADVLRRTTESELEQLRKLRADGIALGPVNSRLNGRRSASGTLETLETKSDSPS